MKVLDKTKKYDLSKLNDEQLKELQKYLLDYGFVKWGFSEFKDFKTVSKNGRVFNFLNGDWWFHYYKAELKCDCFCATELFTPNYEVTRIVHQQNPQIEDFRKNLGEPPTAEHIINEIVKEAEKRINAQYEGTMIAEAPNENSQSITDEALLNHIPDVGKKAEQPKEKNFKEIGNSIVELLDYKNSQYGNSALEPLDIFNNKCKVGQRLDDKLARIKNAKELRKNDVCDLIGYLFLTCQENEWFNFDEFKD